MSSEKIKVEYLKASEIAAKITDCPHKHTEGEIIQAIADYWLASEKAQLIGIETLVPDGMMFERERNLVLGGYITESIRDDVRQRFNHELARVLTRDIGGHRK